MRKLVILIALAIFLSANSFQNAVKFAQKTKRLILVEVYSEYCGYSKAMRKKVFKKPDIRRVLREKYVLFRVNIDKEIKGLPKHFYTEKTPTYYFLSSDGKKLLEEIIGEMKKDDFMWFLKETYNDCIDEK